MTSDPLPSWARFTLSDEALEPRGIGTWGDRFLYELDLDAPTVVGPYDVGGELALSLDGQDMGTYAASFETCIRFGGELEPPEPASYVVYQRLTLTTEAGVLDEDGWAGFECFFADGRGGGGIP